MALENSVHLSGENLAVLYELLEGDVLDDDRDLGRSLKNAVSVGNFGRKTVYVFEICESWLNCSSTIHISEFEDVDRKHIMNVCVYPQTVEIYLIDLGSVDKMQLTSGKFWEPWLLLLLLLLLSLLLLTSIYTGRIPQL